jgi:hypothetical protein
MCSRELKFKVTEIVEESFEDHERPSENELGGPRSPFHNLTSDLIQFISKLITHLVVTDYHIPPPTLNAPTTDAVSGDLPSS